MKKVIVKLKAVELPKKLYKVIDNSSTKYLPVPLAMDEIVELVEDGKEVEDGYIKVKHSGTISTFSRYRFKRHITKTK